MARMVIKDEQWKIVEFLVKEKKTKRGKPRVIDDRLILEAVLYVMRTGCQWRELPFEFPNWKSVYSRFSSWNKNGVWNRIWSVLKKSYKANIRNEYYYSILR